MKKSNSKGKAPSAFKKLGAVALITATLAMCFTACNQTGGGGGGKPTPTPKPKHAITFGVDSTTPNGTLKVEGDGIIQPATSPINVEEGKTITFTATANDGYRVKGWTLDNSPITEAGKNEKYQLTVTKTATVSVSFELRPVKGGAVLILSPDHLTIRVVAETADGSDVQVEGCTETTFASNTQAGLHAKGTRVVLKGKITELKCDFNQLIALNVQGCASLRELRCEGNKLTSLNVQGLTALKSLYCYSNQLNAQAMTALLNALPARVAGDGAFALLYTEITGIIEGNHKDYTQPEDLKKAFDGAKKRNWQLRKENASGYWEEL